jgi:hypothetical protein
MFIVCVVAAGCGAKLIDDKVLGIGKVRLLQFTPAIQTFVWSIHQIFPRANWSAGNITDCRRTACPRAGL